MALKTEPAPRIAYLDGLRALAVLLVLAHHAMLHSPMLTTPVPFFSAAHFMLEGSHGVDLFFVLSGFCLSYPLLERLRREGTAAFNVHRYFAKRIVRIVPPYYAAVALFALLPHTASPVEIVKQLLFLDWHTTFLNGSFWTLCVEFRWYFLFPLALALWIRSPRVFCAVALAAVFAYQLTRLHAPDVGTLLPFMLGIVAADIEARAVRIEPLVWLLLPVCVLLGLVLEQTSSMPAPSGGETPIFFVQTNAGWQVAAFMLVIGASRLQLLRRTLSFAPLVAIGTASYSIYLIHEPVIAMLAQRMPWHTWEALAAAYAVAIVTGFAFWALFERAWMFGRLKQIAIAALQPRIGALAGALDLPSQVHFTKEPIARPEFGLE